METFPDQFNIDNSNQVIMHYACESMKLARIATMEAFTAAIDKRDFIATVDVRDYTNSVKVLLFKEILEKFPYIRCKSNNPEHVYFVLDVKNSDDFYSGLNIEISDFIEIPLLK